MTSDTNPADDVLVGRARSGDRDAFSLLVRRYQDAVFRIVRRTSQIERELAEDLAQETFLRAYGALARFRGECSFAHWLFRIATNLTLNRVTTVAAKTERRSVSLNQPSRATDDEDRMELEDERQAAPTARMEQRELRDVLERALARLPDEFRAAVVLRDVEGLDYDAIAEILEVPVGTVRSRIHRGREGLREIIIRVYDVPVLETGADGALA